MRNSISTTLALFFLLCCCYSKLQAQCSAGQNAVTVTVETDGYGYEGYWELLPAGNNCGNGTLLTGGNSTQVGCNGGGQQDATPGNGYGNSQTYNSAEVCLTTGGTYKLTYVDDYGDGGFHIYVNIDGLPMYHYVGTGTGNSWTFTVTPALTYNSGMEKITSVGYSLVGAVPVKAKVFNYGATTINSLVVNYSIDNGTPTTQTISGLSIAPYSAQYEFTFATPWNATTVGSYQLKVWTGDINGNPDMNPANDMLTKTVVIGNPIPNILDQYATTTPVITTISAPSNGLAAPRDLDFQPTLSNYELWVVCEETEADGGSTVTYSNAGKPNQTVVKKEDDNNWHFMALPTGIAFGDDGWFATSPGIYDANHGSGHFTGPALWDPEVYTVPNPGNGSHMDMLHQSPYSMGIAWERDLVYWVFDGNSSNIVRYNFVTPHDPGGEDHSAGKVWRYSDVVVSMINTSIPAHLVLDAQKKWLYIVDGGSARVIRMDITTGSAAGNLTPYQETLAEYKNYLGATQQVVVNTGMAQPSGIDVLGNRMIVSDYSNGNIYLYDISTMPATLLTTIATQPGICGVKIGPDGLIYFVNRIQNKVQRIDGPVFTDIAETQNSLLVGIAPNPANNTLFVSLPNVSGSSSLKIFNLLGEEVVAQVMSGSQTTIDVAALPAGNYLLQVANGNQSITKKLLVQH